MSAFFADGASAGYTDPPDRAATRTELRVNHDPVQAPAREFDDFYAAHVRSLTAQLWAYTGSQEQAQDVVHEAFCRAFARWSKVSGYDDPAAWVRRVAWNLATSGFRQHVRFRAFARRHQEKVTPEPSPDRVALTAALAAIPAQQRRVIVLHYLADLSVAEIAAMDGLAEGSVKSWLHRGRAALAGKLSDARKEGRDV